MEKSRTFITIYRNVDAETKKVKYKAVINIGDVKASSSAIPPFNPAWFTQSVTKTGVKCMSSKRPLLVTHTEVEAGEKPGVYFTNIIAIEEPPQVSPAILDKFFSDEAPEAPEAPKPSKETAEEAPQEVAEAKADEF